MKYRSSQPPPPVKNKVSGERQVTGVHEVGIALPVSTNDYIFSWDFFFLLPKFKGRFKEKPVFFGTIVEGISVIEMLSQKASKERGNIFTVVEAI